MFAVFFRTRKNYEKAYSIPSKSTNILYHVHGLENSIRMREIIHMVKEIQLVRKK